MGVRPFRHKPPGHLERQVEAFSGAMLHELRGHEHIGNWDDWKPSMEELELKISKAWVQLKQNHAAGNFRRVQELAADIANYAQKAFKLYGKG